VIEGGAAAPTGRPMEERVSTNDGSRGPRAARSPRTARATRSVLAAVAAVVAAVGAGGCHWDSYIDPSVVGRWEKTPTIVPILEDIDEIEESTGEFSEFTEVQPEDLLPEPATYAIAAGDLITVQLWDLVVRGQPVVETNTVDASGAVDILQIGRVEIAGLSEQQAAQTIARRMSAFVADPLVSLTVESRREQAFQLSGAVARPGSYAIPSGDYRLLEALISAGGVAESAPYLYVIRQVEIGADDAARPNPVQDTPPTGDARPFPTAPVDPLAPARPAPARPEDADVDDLIDIIDDLSAPSGSPVAMGTSMSAERASFRGTRGGSREGWRSGWQPGEGPDPLVDLVEEDPATPATTEEASTDEPAAATGATRWVFRDGRWVQVASRPSSSATTSDPLGGLPDTFLTQRIIRIPIQPVVNGDARYNIVVRPGDVVRVPPPESGNVYIGGQINRPGVYALPNVGRLTLTRVIYAAGGLGGLAIPERVDLTRMIGTDRQATVMLNYRAIAEGTQPDVFLKRDDVVNIGTNFWAFPLAVVRNGFRATYGFGFLLDRNFGTDVFGAPPQNINNTGDPVIQLF